ncbi:MAG: hypothetical protein AAGH70_01515 [Pseudomonadota bacterium]
MTKHFAAAAIALTLTTSAAFASNEFGILDGIEAGATYYDVSLVQADGTGIIQIETMTGEVLGTAELTTETNTNVRVDFDAPAPNEGLVAKLIIDGEIVDEERIFLSN